jgi:hypothetical protein
VKLKHLGDMCDTDEIECKYIAGIFNGVYDAIDVNNTIIDDDVINDYDVSFNILISDNLIGLCVTLLEVSETRATEEQIVLLDRCDKLQKIINYFKGISPADCMII